VKSKSCGQNEKMKRSEHIENSGISEDLKKMIQFLLKQENGVLMVTKME